MTTMELITDKEYFGQVMLFDADGQSVAFEKIALIPYDSVLYTILCPQEMLDKGEYNCALIYKIVEGEKGDDLQLVDDDEIISQIFTLYYELEEELYGQE